MEGSHLPSTSSSMNEWDNRQQGMNGLGNGFALGNRMIGRNGLVSLLWSVLPTVLAIGTGLLVYHLTGEDANYNNSNNNVNNINNINANDNINNNDPNNTNNDNKSYSNQIELDDFNNSYNDDNNDNNYNNINNNNSFISYKSTDSIKPEWAVELLDEVKLLKEFLMSPKKNDNNTDSNDNNSKVVENKPTQDELISTLKIKIIDMINMTKHDLAFEAFKVGISTLIMYFKKIVENPQVPRYKRIPKTNQNFRTLVEPMKGYDAVMTAAGFRDLGSNLEYYPNSSTAIITPTSSPLKSTNNDDSDSDNKKQLLSTSIETLELIVNSEGYDDALGKIEVDNDNDSKSILAPFPTVQSDDDNVNRNIDSILNFDVISGKAKASINKSIDNVSNDKICLDSDSKDDKDMVEVAELSLSPIRR